MQVSLLFPTRFLSAADLIQAGGRDVTLTIARAYAEDLQVKGGGTLRKLLLEFHGAKKQLVLCKTSAYVIAGLYGPETDDWAGKRVTLYHTMVDAFGKMVPAIRIRAQVPPAPKPAAFQTVQTTETPAIDSADLVAAGTNNGAAAAEGA